MRVPETGRRGRSAPQARKTADQATWEIHPKTGEHVLSPRGRDLLGLAPDEPVSIQRLVAAVHPSDRDRWKDAIQSLLDVDGPDEIRVDFRSAALPSRWLVAVGRAMFEGLSAIRAVGTLEESSPVLHRERVLLNEVCQEAVEETRLDYPQRTIHLERWSDPQGVWDGEQVRDVVRDLIWSAVIQSRPTAPIRVSAVDCGDQALVVVAYLGKALPAQLREHLLAEEHHDLEPSAVPVLCRCLEIVRAHGGRMDLNCEHDSTVFHVWLPKKGERERPDQPTAVNPVAW